MDLFLLLERIIWSMEKLKEEIDESDQIYENEKK